MIPHRRILAAVLAAGLYAFFVPTDAHAATPQKITSVKATKPLAQRGVVKAARCARPAIPQGGLPVVKLYDNTVVYSDGYVTLADMTRPSGPAPVCGWPLVVVVHGLPGSRLGQRPLCEFLAGQGYAAWAYEVRGQSEAVALNPGGAGFDWYGPDLKLDLAEQIAHVRATDSSVHAKRVAVTGNSQGAIHSWFAAAYSQVPISAPGRPTRTFPRIDCAVPIIFNADVHDQLLRGQTMFQTNFVRQAFTPNQQFLIKDQAFVANVQTAFLNQDPDALLSSWQAEPDRIWTDRFDTSRVPVLWMHGYFDNTLPPSSGIDLLQQFPPTTPTRAVLSTEGHQSPANDYERDYRSDMRLRWLERFLWGIKNQVELETPIVHAAMPTDENDIDDRTHLWGHRVDASFDPMDTVTDRMYFDATGQLTPTSPAVFGTQDLLHTVNTPGFDANDWVATINQWNNLNNVTAEFPLNEILLAAAPLAAETEIIGRPLFDLSLTANATEFQLAAALEAVVPGNTKPIQLGQWAVGVVDAIPGVAARHTIELPGINTVLPPGTILQARLRNYWVNEAPMNRVLQAVPYFTPVNITINMGAGLNSSFVNVPLRTRVRLAVKTSTTFLDLAAPTSTFLEIEGSASRAGHTYQVIMGASGQLPGFQTGGPTLPVTPDGLTSRSQSLIAQGHPGLINLEGVLDAEGKATAEIQWQNLPSLLNIVGNQRIVIATLTTSGNDLSASNPVDFPAQ